VALHAGYGCVESGQRPIGIERVIERSQGRPVGVGVAGVACGWEGHSHVTRIRGSGEIRLVAAIAVGR